MTSSYLAKTLYLQIKENIEEGIHSGKYPIGSRLPSENDLCKMFNVSRITIRKALNILENNGMIYSIHGKGTFVKTNVIDSELKKISSFGATLKNMGYSGFTKVIKYEERKTNDFERLLHGDEWKRASYLSLLGYSMDEPVVFYRSVIRCPYGDEMYRKACELEEQGIPFSTFDLYAQINLEIGKIDQKVFAVNADEEIAKFLNKKPGDAILVLDSVIMDKNMQMIEYKKGYYSTDKYTFNLNREL